ncbi:TonB-dependent receptor plug domain-containing protein [Ahniella affigens]|nr:TonB-dependent receptor [Ahniella affigens]
MKNPFQQSALAAAMGLAFHAHAVPTESRGEQVVVTATGLAETVDATRATVVVIDRARIDARQTADVLELLRLEAGVEFSRTGGRGSLTTLFLRGGNSNHALVLIDGVRVSSANTGFYDFSQLPTDLIERVEIVYGPRAANWGSDAIGGVVQFFLRKPEQGLVGIRVGSKDQRDAFAAYSLRGERGLISVTAGRQHSGGFSASNPNGFGFNPDDDAFNNTHVSLAAETEVFGQTLALHGLSSDADVEFDQGRSDFSNLNTALSLQGAWSERWSHRLSLGHNRDEVDTPAYFSRYESSRETLDWNHRYRLNDGNDLAFGVNWNQERGGEVETFGGSDVYREHRHHQAAYLGWLGDIGAHSFELTGRFDDNSRFGSAETVQAAWAWQIDADWQLRAQYGEGFRSPTLSEQFSPGFGGLFAGNPDLDPEQSQALELSVRWQIAANQDLGLNLYQNLVDDLIAFQGENFQAINIARARIEGAELRYHLQQGAWHWAGNITVQNPENRDTGADLLRRAPRKLNLTADYDINERWRVGAEGELVSQRAEFGGDLPGFGLVHLSAGYALRNDLWLRARVENLFDQNYELARGFNTPGTTVSLSLVFGR